MDLQRSLVWLAGLLFAGMGTASAVDHAVSVGGVANVFTPKTLTINAGDTVTFTYAGGAPHNVVSDQPGLFRCANGCDGAGGNGNLATGWHATVTFANAGTFGYFCEAHGSSNGAGMAGSIIVNAVTAPSIPIGGYISGNWFNTSQGGSGFQLEATNATDSATGLPVMLAIWFVYTPDGTGQNWIFAQGDYDPTKSSVTLPAQLFTGTSFPPNYVAGNVHGVTGGWGTVTFSFTDCNNGTASWNSTVSGYGSGGPMAITRLTQIDGTTCPK